MEQDATVDPIIPGAALVTLSESDEEPDDDFDENEEAEDDDAHVEQGAKDGTGNERTAREVAVARGEGRQPPTAEQMRAAAREGLALVTADNDCGHTGLLQHRFDARIPRSEFYEEFQYPESAPRTAMGCC